MKFYDITPVPKPRMTQQDRWKRRSCVMRYRNFCDKCKEFELKFESGNSVVFILPMPKSWSKRKKEKYNNKPHLSTPDLDNLLKALCDALYKNDSIIWKCNGLEKRWGYEGKIFIY